jgi:hypothetical protein
LGFAVPEGKTMRIGSENVGGIFSVEMESKKHIRSISISDETYDRVIFEGDLGRLLEVSIIECCPLEMVGEHGVMRCGER